MCVVLRPYLILSMTLVLWLPRRAWVKQFEVWRPLYVPVLLIPLSLLHCPALQLVDDV